MYELTLKVRKAIVVSGRGNDKCSIDVEAPTQFPNLGYEPFLSFDTSPGHGVQWLVSLGIPRELIEVIDLPPTEYKFSR
jgi:hypothetical protein